MNQPSGTSQSIWSVRPRGGASIRAIGLREPSPGVCLSYRRHPAGLLPFVPPASCRPLRFPSKPPGRRRSEVIELYRRHTAGRLSFVPPASSRPLWIPGEAAWKAALRNERVTPPAAGRGVSSRTSSTLSFHPPDYAPQLWHPCSSVFIRGSKLPLSNLQPPTSNLQNVFIRPHPPARQPLGGCSSACPPAFWRACPPASWRVFLPSSSLHPPEHQALKIRLDPCIERWSGVRCRSAGK